MGLFGGFFKRETIAKRKKKAEKEFFRAKEEKELQSKKENTRILKRETRELKLKPVKERVQAFKSNLNEMKKSSRSRSNKNTISSSDSVRSSIYGSSGDKTRAILYGGGHNPFYENKKWSSKGKSKKVTILIK